MILFRTEADAETAWSKVFEDASLALKGSILFSYSDGTNDIQEKLMEFMGVTPADLPTLRVITPEKMNKYMFENLENVSVD